MNKLWYITIIMIVLTTCVSIRHVFPLYKLSSFQMRNYYTIIYYLILLSTGKNSDELKLTEVDIFFLSIILLWLRA